MTAAPTILYEDNHCLALDKPAGWLSQGDASGDASLVTWAQADLKARYNKPGNVFVGLIHRLDRPVSGVVLLARTSKGASRLSEQFRAGTVTKWYWAVVEGELASDEGEWRDELVKDRSENRVHSVEGGEDAKPARTLFRVLERLGGSTLVCLHPLTGRSHQLRAQLASRGSPIWGDVKYGAGVKLGALDGGPRVALHAVALQFDHPTRKGERISIASPIPEDWPTLWRERCRRLFDRGIPGAEG